MKSSLLRVLAVLVAAPLLFAPHAAAQYPEGHWQNFAPYPQPTQEVGGAVVNGKLYILGGYGANAPGGLAGWLKDRKSTRLTPVTDQSRMPSSSWKQKHC